MKWSVFIAVLIMAFPAAAQDINLGLIPTPQNVETGLWKKDSVDTRRMKVKEKQVDGVEIDLKKTSQLHWVQSNVEQAYVLTIEPKGITIEYYGKEGLANGYLTLAQLHRLYGDVLPCCRITDWPAYRYRGWMDDQSRGPVPHAAYRQKQWETLHALKFNFCNYYTEHTLYQPEFPDLAPAYLADCKPHPDEVINLQLFAHAEKTLRVPFYQNLMDSKANFDPSNEATYDFLCKRIKAAYDRIPNSPFFIINCDETEQLGTGRAKKLVDSLGTDQVYVDFINRCYDIVRRDVTRHVSNEEDVSNPDKETCHGTSLRADNDMRPRVAMWGDIVAKNPAMMRQLPKDMTYIMWAYEPLDSYDHLIKPFKDNGTPFWVAPSLSHSSNMIPNPYRYMKNIANLARDGWRNGAEGLMNTCWDDNGEALFDNCWHGLFWSAEMAWNPIKTDDPEEFARRERQFNENFERLFYGAKDIKDSKDLKDLKVAQLYAVGALESDPDIADWYTSAALMEPLLNFNPDNTHSPALVDRVNAVERLIASIQVDSAANSHVHYALHRIKATAQKANLRYVVYHALENYEPYAEEYLQTLFDLKREYLHLWDQENGEYERYIVCNRYDDLAREVLELDRHVFVNVECGMRNGELNGTSANSSLITHHSSFPYVTLRTLYNDCPIYYTLDGSEPTAASTKYTGPFPLERSATIRAITYNEYGEGVISEQYLLSHLGMGAKIKLNTPYSTYKSIYSGGGEDALIDGQLGSNTTYADGHWQGYWGDSIDAVIDFGKPTEIHEVTMRFMQNTFDWILAPRDIVLMVSDDGEHWTIQVNWPGFNFSPRETGMRLRYCRVPIFQGVTTRYLRVVVPNPGPLPEWHPAPGQPSYLFTDEIVIH